MPLSLTQTLSRLKLADLAFETKALLCVGADFNREEVKQYLFSRNPALGKQSVVKLPGLCQFLFNTMQPLLTDFARFRIYQQLLLEPAVKNRLPFITQIHRQKNGPKLLDESLQQTRLFFAHETEWQVAKAILHEAKHKDSETNAQDFKHDLHVEIEIFAHAYEAYLEQAHLLDFPLLLKKVTYHLAHGNLDPHKDKRLTDCTIFRLDFNQGFAAETLFWQELSAHFPVTQLNTEPPTETPKAKPTVDVYQYHTLFDAAFDLKAQLANHPTKTFAILLPDDPLIRQALDQGLKWAHTQAKDDRNPTLVRTDEKIKTLLLPFTMLFEDFEKTAVIAFLKLGLHKLAPTWIDLIEKHGAIQGLQDYSFCPKLQEYLAQFQKPFSGLQPFEVFFAHGMSLLLTLLRDIKDARPDLPGSDNVLWFDAFQTIQTECQKYFADLQQSLCSQEVHCASYWCQQIAQRIFSAKAKVALLKQIPLTDSAWPIFRLSQASIEAFDHIYLFGPPAHTFTPPAPENLWIDASSLDILSKDFDLPTRSRMQAHRFNQLAFWLRKPNAHLTLLTAAWSPTGQALSGSGAGLDYLVSQLTTYFQLDKPQVHQKPVNPFIAASYQNTAPNPTRLKIHEPSLASSMGPVEPLTVSASALDRYSVCPMIYWAQDALKITSPQKAQLQLSPRTKGNLLHLLAKKIIEQKIWALDDEHQLTHTLQELVATTDLEYLFAAHRITSCARNELINILRRFCQKELAFQTKVQKHATLETLALDTLTLSHELTGFLRPVVLRGRPDRIETIKDFHLTELGMLLLEYKTRSSLPKAPDILSQAKGIQMAVYGFILHKQLQATLLGYHYVQLNKAGSRSSGVLLSRHNKQNAHLSDANKNVLSLIDLTPDELAKASESVVLRQVELLTQGIFEAKISDSCKGCHIRPICKKDLYADAAHC
jgi:hypothetical protein